MITWLIRAAIVAAVIGAIIFAYTTWRNSVQAGGIVIGKSQVQALWDDETKARQAAAIAATERFRKQERVDATRATEIENDARQRETASAAAATRSATAAGGLSRDIAALNAAARSRGLPTAAACPAEFARERDAAIAARNLFGACTAEYREMAESADGVRLKLSTALSFIAVVAPAQ